MVLLRAVAGPNIAEKQGFIVVISAKPRDKLARHENKPCVSQALCEYIGRLLRLMIVDDNVLYHSRLGLIRGPWSSLVRNADNPAKGPRATYVHALRQQLNVVTESHRG